MPLDDRQPDGSPAITPPVLRGVGLIKTYRMGDVLVHALRGVDFELGASEFLVLLGPSGSGKSTLLNLLGGLDIPTEGHLFYHDRELNTRDERAMTRYRRNHVGFVFQFYNLIPSLTARENVELVTDIAKNPMVAAEALDLVGLGSRLDHFPSQLSGGEQQRVAIARAVAKRPQLLLCDEPTGALDVTTGKVVIDVLLRINRELKTATAIITHNAGIAKIAHRVVTLADGRVASDTRNATRISAEELQW